MNKKNEDELKQPTTLQNDLPGAKIGAEASNLPLSADDDATVPKVAPTYDKTLDLSGMMYDPTTDDNYLKALAALNQATANKPKYAATYDSQLNDLYNQIVNRDKFTYDVNSDALYQQYAQQYSQGGKLAMQDTMGQAAAMTGGYGNSYAQTVGQQTYQGYMQQLNDKVPELYDRALAQYNQEGQDMLNQYSMLGDMRDTEYGRYMDALNNYWQNVSYQQKVADTAYNQGYTAMADQRAAAQAEYSAGYDQFLNQWNMQNTLDQQAQDQANWDKSFNYGVERDKVADEQWDQTFEYGKERDRVADSQWEQQFKYNQEQDAKDDAYRQQTFEYQQEQDKQEWKYQQKQDAKAEVLEILKIGGTPTSKQLIAADMDIPTAQAYQKYFEASAAYESGNGAEHVKTMSSSELVAAVQGYIENDDTSGLEMFLDDCVATGRMTEDQALGYYDQARNKAWTSYEDAAAAGYSNIMTEAEFRKRSNVVSQYGTYDKYLEAMHTKYMR